MYIFAAVESVFYETGLRLDADWLFDAIFPVIGRIIIVVIIVVNATELGVSWLTNDSDTVWLWPGWNFHLNSHLLLQVSTDQSNLYVLTLLLLLLYSISVFYSEFYLAYFTNFILDSNFSSANPTVHAESKRSCLNVCRSSYYDNVPCQRSTSAWFLYVQL